jgi:putative sigma-54 modulation protein
MELNVYGKNVEITQEIKNHAQKKMEKLARYLPSMDDAKVEIFEEKTKSPGDRYTVQITIHSKGNLFRAEERATGIDMGLEMVTDVLARQIDRFKGRLSRKGK